MINKLRNFYYILFLYICFEIMACAGLIALETIKHITYDPTDIHHWTDFQLENLDEAIEQRSKYISTYPDYGWTVLPSGTTDLYQANSQGIRGNKEYKSEIPEGEIRMMMFGDSFTHGDNVKNHETWPARMEFDDPRIETLNFGVPGFGLDQAFLRYQNEATPFQTDIIIIGFYSDDIHRHVSYYTPFRTSTGPAIVKPRYILEGDSLRLIPNILRTPEDFSALKASPETIIPQYAPYDYFYKYGSIASAWDILPSVRFIKIMYTRFYPKVAGLSIMDYNMVYNVDSEAYKITIKLFDKFYQAVASSGAVPVILLFPEWGDVSRFRDQQPIQYTPLLQDLKTKGYHVIDAMDAFVAVRSNTPVETYIQGHFTPEGNHEVAKLVLSKLYAEGIVPVPD